VTRCEQVHALMTVVHRVLARHGPNEVCVECPTARVCESCARGEVRACAK